MLTLTIPNRRDPLPRAVLLALVAVVVYAAFASASAPEQARAQADIIIVATPQLPQFTPVPELALISATPAPLQAFAPPEIAPAEIVYVEVQSPAPPPEIVYVEAQTETAPPAAPQEFAPAADPATQYGTPEFNAALVEVRNDLPTLQCPCGPDAAAEAASDAYQQRRLDAGARRPSTR